MRKNLLAQLIYRVILCCVSAFAVLVSLRVFYIESGGRQMSWDILKYYTNLSNYLVFLVSVVVTADTVRKVKNGEREGYNTKWRTLKFMTVVMILVTFLVVMALLEPPITPDYWLDLGNMSYHFMAPLLFILDYILFDEKRSLSAFVPAFSLIPPLVYVGYIFILGAAIPNFEYPYFFLNVNRYGYGGVCLWVLGLLAVFAALGYLLWLWNRFDKVDGKWKFDFSGALHFSKSSRE